MYEGHLITPALVAGIDLQLFDGDDDLELGPALEIDVDALGDDVGKLKTMLGKALHDNKRVRSEAGKRRTALRAAERQQTELKTQLEAATADKTKLTADLETANRANGQHRANFQKQLVDRDLRGLLTEAGAIDIDLILPAIKRDAITCDDETFAIAGAKEAVEAFKGEKANLFAKPGTVVRGTSTTGTGPQGAGAGSGAPPKVDYRDRTKTLAQLERESDLAHFGRMASGAQ